MQKWYGISVYPSSNGLSVYFRDITENETSEVLLIDSEKRYSELFQLSPLTKWVFALGTLEFLDVNQVAIIHYGYTREEFLSMTIKDIRPSKDVVILDKILNLANSNGDFVKRGIFSAFRSRNSEGKILLIVYFLSYIT